jgi:xanthine/uracil permease
MSEAADERLPPGRLVAAAVPQCVLGGVGVVMFGAVAALFRAAPDALKPILDSGILLATVAAVPFNAFFNTRWCAAQAYASQADHA